MSKNIEEIIEMFCGANKLPSIPKEKPLKEGSVLDENQSVKWNREQVLLSKEKYKEELRQLRKQRNDAFIAAKKEACLYICENLNNYYTLTQCEKIFNRAYEEGHAAGETEVMNTVEDYIDFLNDINR